MKGVNIEKEISSFLKKQKKDIKQLEKQINNYDKNSIKRKKITNLKISFGVLRKIAPYVLTAGIVVGVAKFTTGCLPFYRDDVKECLHTMKEYDSNGNIRTEEQYGAFGKEDTLLTYYSKWEKNYDGNYSRTKQIYSLKDMCEVDVEKIINDDVNIRSILGMPIKSSIESSNNLTTEEINQDAYIQAIIYDINTNDFIYIKESSKKNFKSTIIILIINGILECIIPPKFFSFNLSKYIRKIKQKYQAPDLNKLKKDLSIKKDNYNRLTRG